MPPIVLVLHSTSYLKIEERKYATALVMITSSRSQRVCRAATCSAYRKYCTVSYCSSRQRLFDHSVWRVWNTRSLDLRLHSTHNLISIYLYSLHLSFPWMGFSLPQQISSATRAVPAASARLPAAGCAWIPSSSRGDTASPSWWHARVSAAASAASIRPDNNNDNNNCWCASSTDVPSLLRQRRV